MTFDDKLNELIDRVEVPDELSPENIAAMLKARAAEPSPATEHRNIKSAPNFAAQRRTIIMRTSAAVAACAVFAVGMLAFNDNNDDAGQIDDQISYAAVSPDSYDDLYNIYTGIYLDGNAPEETSPYEAAEPQDGTEPIAEARDVPEETLADPEASEFTALENAGIMRADIVKTDGSNLYCISGNKLYIVSMETMTVIAELENKLNPPVELYISDNKLILVSKENEEVQTADIPDGTASDNTSSVTAPPASDVPADETDTVSQTDMPLNSDKPEVSRAGAVCRTNAVVDIYDISDKTNPTHTTSYKQNGSYTSSRIVNGVLYMVTEYCNYRSAPLDKNADLDSYVPAYYIDGEKYYVAAGDITVPANANSTDYTVISAVNIESGTAAVKAVLGSSRNVYCSADTLYIAGVGKSNSDSDYSVITSFSLSDEGMTYKASSSVAGKVISGSMNEYNGSFRIATEITDENGTSAAIYVLDDTLTAVRSAGQLLAGQNVTSVRFEENYASLYINGESEAAMVIDLSCDPPVQAQSSVGRSAYLYSFSDNMLLGLSKAENGIELTMYNSEGLVTGTAVIADDAADVSSPALKDRRALLIDIERSLIGVPVYEHNEFGTRSRYFVCKYTEGVGFETVGSIEYSDLDDSRIFRRAVISGDTLYVIGGTRIAAVQLEDFKVIDSYEF